MHTLSRRAKFLLTAAAPVLAGCATGSQRAYVAATNETVVATTEARTGGSPSHSIIVENRSTVPITVFGVSLSSCENVKQRCESYRLNYHIAPGSRLEVLRVQPDNPERGFTYRYNYSWHADSSGVAALAALAGAGDSAARTRLSAYARSDSLSRTEVGVRYADIPREQFGSLGSRAVALRTDPDSLLLEPGQHFDMERLHFLLVDAQGQVLGQTRWIRWSVFAGRTLQFVPPAELIARRTGRGAIRIALSDQAQAALGKELAEISIPVAVAYRPDPHAPVFAGRAVDAESNRPLGCAQVALEDSAANVVAAGRTQPTGTFVLQAPRSGSYRLRFDLFGWAPMYGAVRHANEDERTESDYAVRFADQLLVTRDMDDPDFQHVQPVAVAVVPTPSSRARGSARSVPIIQGVTLGGSASMPILGIVGRVAPTTTWAQFVVDSTGRVDSTSITVPAGTPSNELAGISSVLPRVRFSPPTRSGR